MQVGPARASFIGLLNVVATEDFPLLPKMQRNFEAAKHAETIFGANEPALTDRHVYFSNKWGGPGGEHKEGTDIGGAVAAQAVAEVGAAAGGGGAK